MAFSVGNSGGSSQARQGPDLQEISTERLGFLSLAGETKLRLYPSAWPSEQLPPPTASLLTISSSKGLVAAGGQDGFIVATTESVRQAFKAAGPSENNVKPFQPQLHNKTPRLNQLVFTSDGSHLVMCAEQGGGLAVYETQSLQQGGQPAFEIATNGISVRALVPNPAPELASAVAIVLAEGQLMLADLKTRQFQLGPNGPVLGEGVSCVAWSNKGKQLVAGLGNGTAVQMDVQSVKATIPRPPGLDQNQFMSRVLWLANDEFIVVHTPVDPGNDEIAPPSTIHVVNREKGTQNYAFQKVADPCGPFGLKRAPQHHFFSRLRLFPPDIADLIITASTSSSDIGLISKATQPLSSQPPQIINEFTTTNLQEDSRRAMLPPTDMSETSPIGMALDLSSTELVPRPIRGDEMDHSPTPLPAIMVLNNEGLLSAWWIVYDDALRRKLPYGELEACKGAQIGTTMAGASTNASQFGSPSLSQQGPANAFAKPQSTFGTPAFGGQPATPAFGGASGLGAKTSPWASSSPTTNPQQSAFGQPAFGQPAFGKPAFGQPAFGQPGGSAAPTAPKSLWGSSAAAPANSSDNKSSPFSGGGSSASPFAAFSAKSGAAASPFATIGADQNAPSPFASKGASTAASFGMKTEPSFGSTVTIGSSNGGSTLGSNSFLVGKNEAFGAPAVQKTSLFGNNDSTKPPEVESTTAGTVTKDGSANKADQPGASDSRATFSGFKLQSSFKPDEVEAQQLSTADGPKQVPAPSMLGDGFRDALLGTQSVEEPATPIKDTLTDSTKQESTTPATPAVPSSIPQNDTRTIAKVSASALPSIPEASQKTPSRPASPGPLAGSSPEEIQVPDSGGLTDDEEEVEQVIEDAPLPPDPSTVKVSKDFYSNIPGMTTPSKSLFGIPPAAAKAAQALRPPKASAPSLVPSTTPAGFPKESLFASAAARPQSSPRSPSPVRSASTPAGIVPPLSSHATIEPPVNFDHSMFAQRSTYASSKQMPLPKEVSPPLRQNVLVQPQPTQAYYIAPSGLEDAEADRVQAILAQPIQPSPDLKEFQAHQDYVASEAFASLSSSVGPEAGGFARLSRQIETIFRDINDMVDTLGMNARHLEEWLAWNGSSKGGEQREIEDLVSYGENIGTDDEERWPLVEMEDLALILDELDRNLEDGRVQPQDKSHFASDLQGRSAELKNQRRRFTDVRRWLQTATSPEERQKQLEEALPFTVAAMQRELNTKVAKFKALLVQAEEETAILKAKVARVSKAPPPTLEAVTRTIEKVNSITREKSEDIDALEGRMRKLGLLQEPDLAASMRSMVIVDSRSSPSRSVMRSRGGTPDVFATPRTSASTLRHSKLGRWTGTSSVERTPTEWRSSLHGPQASVKMEEIDQAMSTKLAAARRRKRLLVRDELIKGLVRRAEAAETISQQGLIKMEPANGAVH